MLYNRTLQQGCHVISHAWMSWQHNFGWARYVNTATRFWSFPDLDMNHDETTRNDEEEWEDPEQQDWENDINEVCLENVLEG